MDTWANIFRLELRDAQHAFCDRAEQIARDNPLPFEAE